MKFIAPASLLWQLSILRLVGGYTHQESDTIAIEDPPIVSFSAISLRGHGGGGSGGQPGLGAAAATSWLLQTVVKAKHLQPPIQDEQWEWIAAGVSITLLVVGVVAFFVLRFRWGGKPDASVVLHVTFEVAPEKKQEFRDNLSNFYDVLHPEVEHLLYYGWAFEEKGDKVICREAYKDAAGLLRHVEHVSIALDRAQVIGKLTSLEVSGPSEELDALREIFGPLGTRFQVLDPCSRLYLARLPSVWTKRGVDTSSLMRATFSIESDKLEELRGVLKEYYAATTGHLEKLLNCSVSVEEEETGVVVLQANFEEIDGMFLHLQNVDGPWKQALQIAPLMALEVHVPHADLEKATSADSPFSMYPITKFFVSDVNCKTWTWKGGEIAKLIGNREKASTTEVLAATTQRLYSQLQVKVEKGTRAYQIVEDEAMSFQEKAKVFIINELNTTAHALLKAIDEEEAQMLLDFNRSVEASFPPVSVLLAGIFSPAILSTSMLFHLIQLVVLFVPVALSLSWAVVEDWGSRCDIPTMTGWAWFTLFVTASLSISHAALASTIRSGQAILVQKTQDITDRLTHNADDGETSITDMQEFLIGAIILVQEALLIEDSVKKSFWMISIGPLTLFWMISCIWNFVIVIGWTFVPGQVSFYVAAGATTTGLFCGSWASVFVARVMCLVTPLFFFLNVAQVTHWIIITVINSDKVASALLRFARRFDTKNAGMPVSEILVKAFLLRGSHDVYPAKLTVALGEALRLSMECTDLERELDEINGQLQLHREHGDALRAAAEVGGGDLQGSLQRLEQVSSTQTGAWKERGQRIARDAEVEVQKSREVATAELDRVAAYLTELAEKIRNSESFQGAMASVAEAQEKAAKAAAEARDAALAAANDAQEAATVLAAQAQEGVNAGIAFAQSDEARQLALAASSKAAEAAAKAQENMSVGIAYAQSDEARRLAMDMSTKATAAASSAASSAEKAVKENLPTEAAAKGHRKKK